MTCKKHFQIDVKKINQHILLYSVILAGKQPGLKHSLALIFLDLYMSWQIWLTPCLLNRVCLFLHTSWQKAILPSLVPDLCIISGCSALWKYAFQSFLLMVVTNTIQVNVTRWDFKGLIQLGRSLVPLPPSWKMNLTVRREILTWGGGG